MRSVNGLSKLLKGLFLSHTLIDDLIGIYIYKDLKFLDLNDTQITHIDDIHLLRKLKTLMIKSRFTACGCPLRSAIIRFFERIVRVDEG